MTGAGTPCTTPAGCRTRDAASRRPSIHHLRDVQFRVRQQTRSCRASWRSQPCIAGVSIYLPTNSQLEAALARPGIELIPTTSEIWTLVYLARSANFPTGLYILLALISFFNWSPTISGSTGPIFTFFHKMIGICVNVMDPDMFFRFFKGRCHGNQFCRKQRINNTRMRPFI